MHVSYLWLIPTYNSTSALLRAQRCHRCSTVSQLRLLRVVVVAWTHIKRSNLSMVEVKCVTSQGGTAIEHMDTVTYREG
jgi:hypothetical protein